MVTGDELADRFERGEIPCDSFHHFDHVHLAFTYLSRHPVLEALQKFASAISTFAVSCGKADRYNETITFAYFFLIRERMARSQASGWDEFRDKNPDLLTWKGGILGCYYSEETLKSDLARSVFLLPDKCQ
jgi:hypothetical protein